MKQFSCGDVVPGCTRHFRGSEQQILADVSAHAQADHGLSEVSPALAAQVHQHMTLAV